MVTANTSTSAAGTSGGTVEPANRATVAKERFQTPRKVAGERYELRDPFADTTYRSDKLGEIVAKAAQLGSSRFTAIAADGSRTVVEKVGDDWKRGKKLPPSSQRPLDLEPDDDREPGDGKKPRAATTVLKPEPADNLSMAKVDEEADRAALVERLEAALKERYSQERREELLRQLLKTQQTVQRRGAEQGAGQVELIPLEELQEIRRIWVEEKGEIEDRLPKIYEEVHGKPYPGKELDPMPLDDSDLTLLKDVVGAWTSENLPFGGAEPEKIGEERSAELYKLTRTLLATSFKGLQSRKRSKQLDEIEDVLSAFAFVDEQDALSFAEEHLSDDSSAAVSIDAAEALDVLGEESGSGRKVIPIATDTSPLA